MKISQFKNKSFSFTFWIKTICLIFVEHKSEFVKSQKRINLKKEKIPNKRWTNKSAFQVTTSDLNLIKTIDIVKKNILQKMRTIN